MQSVKASKEKTQAPLADWDVSLSNAEGVASGWHHFPASRWKRTGKKGCCWYTFTDEQGVVAEFPPGVVLSVIRKEPPVVVHPPDGARPARCWTGRNSRPPSGAASPLLA